jgi:hypothetical protein
MKEQVIDFAQKRPIATVSLAAGLLTLIGYGISRAFAGKKSS